MFHAVSARPYRRMVERLVAQLDEARERAIDRLASVGMEPVARPRGGMFVSAGWPGPATPERSAKATAELALKAGILLAPNEFFMLHQGDSAWFRFNVAYAADPGLLRFLQSIR